jgi:hypothetical protein
MTAETDRERSTPASASRSLHRVQDDHEARPSVGRSARQPRAPSLLRHAAEHARLDPHRSGPRRELIG